MGVSAKEEDNLLNQREKKGMKNKKIANFDVEEMSDYRGEINGKLVEDYGAESSKDKKKNKRKKEKKGEGSDNPDFDSFKEEFVNEREHRDEDNKERKKKRKLELERNVKECENEVEFKFTNDKSNKKEKREKVKKGHGSDGLDNNVIEDAEAPNTRGQMGEGNSKGGVETSKDEETRNEVELERTKEEKKKRKKEKRNEGKKDMTSSTKGIFKEKDVEKNEESKRSKMTKTSKMTKKEQGVDKKKRDKGVEEKKKKKKKSKKEGCDVKPFRIKSFDEVSVKEKNSVANEFVKERKKDKDDVEACSREILFEKLRERKTTVDDNEVAKTENHAGSSSKKKSSRKKEVVGNKKDMNKRKKAKSVEDVIDEKVDKGEAKTKKRVREADLSRNSKLEKTSKRVRFSGHVEVFPSPDASDSEDENKEKGLVQGRRFSPKEDKLIEETVSKYIEVHGLGDGGVHMILNCRFYPEVKNCWKEIGASLPWRPLQSIYHRTHILYERADKRQWTPEEYELIRRFHKEHGSDWRKLADELGKHRFHVKDTWRRIKLPNLKKGHWSQEEYQSLFDLVNMDLRMKAFETKKSKHGMLRDGICWGEISDKLSTRTNSTCCKKWYNSLTSNMVTEGKWSDADDYRLLKALFSLDACCVEDVDWDELLDHRPGDVCRKRWSQMINHIGEHWKKSFAEQVEVLMQRYCPDLVEVREFMDSRPVVP